eukprot:GHVP01000049.1.p1 GENE.GHVP01000049.1~~GHVP01000049.1.p1  ORF type:complete len:325 (+),score=89.54 GHVP01000049.1:79-975(+)
MKEEDKKFLKKVVEAVSNSPNPYDIFKQEVAKLDVSASEDICLEALDIMNDISITHPELGRDLDKLESLEPILNILNHRNPEVVGAALQFLGDCLQFNPEVQRSAMDKGALEKVLPLVHWKKDFIEGRFDPPASPVLRKQALGMLSPLIRHDNDAETSFISQDGLYTMLEMMEDLKESYSGRRRAAALVLHFAVERPEDLTLKFKEKLATVIEKSLMEDHMAVEFGEACASLLCFLREESDVTSIEKKAVEHRISFLTTLEPKEEQDVFSEEVRLLKSEPQPSNSLPGQSKALAALIA